jgi:hypothetical protein
LKIPASILLAIVGLIVIGVAVIGILEPIGTQMANDADPFGQPPPLWHGMILMGFGLACIATSAYLLSRSKR